MEQILILIIGCLLSGLGTVLVIQFSKMGNDIKKVVSSVETLNIRIAEVINDQTWHKEEINNLKLRIIALESKG